MASVGLHLRSLPSTSGSLQLLSQHSCPGSSSPPRACTLAPVTGVISSSLARPCVPAARRTPCSGSWGSLEGKAGRSGRAEKKPLCALCELSRHL
eukprot:62661-Hanusia_phi.AAC.2